MLECQSKVSCALDINLNVSLKFMVDPSCCVLFLTDCVTKVKKVMCLFSLNLNENTVGGFRNFRNGKISDRKMFVRF